MTIIAKHSLRKYAATLGGFFVLALIIAACSIKAGELPESANAKPFAGIPVDAAVVNPGIVSEQLEVTGSILANQQVAIVSELTRRIIRVNVKEGSKVKQGTVLFQLDNADLLAQLDRLQQQQKLAQLNEARLKDLVAHEAVALQDYDEASTTLKVIEAQIRELQVTLDKTRITAPFDGQVGMINIHPGAIVSVNTLLTQIEDNSLVKVEFAVPEKYTNIIPLGSVQTFTTPAGKGEYKMTVVAKASSLSTDTRTLLVRGLSANPDGKLFAGQSARLMLSLNTSNDALAVSSQALIPSPGGYVVFVARDNKAVAIPVEIGQRSTGKVEILKGLNPGDTVITSNLLRLSPGAPVDLVSVK